MEFQLDRGPNIQGVVVKLIIQKMIYYQYIQSRNPEKLFMILSLIDTAVKFSAPTLSYRQALKRKRWRHDPCHDWIVVTIKGFIVSFVTTLTWWFHFLSLSLSFFTPIFKPFLLITAPKVAESICTNMYNVWFFHITFRIIE